jgi:phage terminase large subunit
MATISDYAQKAKDSGMSKEQFKRFIMAGYIALPVMLPFHVLAGKINSHESDKTQILLDGTRGSAKSHAVISQVGLDDCQCYPGIKWLFLRKTQKAASESFDDLVSRALRGIPHEQNSEKVTFPNGSKIIIGGYDTDQDIEKYIGIEYDGIVIEEATQIKGDNHEKLRGSLRTSKEGWTPREYLSTNPGGIGHEYVKDMFITDPRPYTARFFSRYSDNPFINKEYKAYLDGLTGDLAKRWRDADWDIFEGQFFSRWRHHVHVIEPFEIKEWPRFVGVDFGTTNPFCALFLAVDYNETVYVYREIYEAGLNATQQAKLILSKLAPKEKITMYLADPSMWTKNQMGSLNSLRSVQDYYFDAGVSLFKANNNRLSGANVVREYLEWEENGVKQPKLKIFNTCKNLIRTIPTLVHDDLRPEDVDTSGEDHAYDALKYGLTYVYAKSKPKPIPTHYDKMLREVTKSSKVRGAYV